MAHPRFSPCPQKEAWLPISCLLYRVPGMCVLGRSTMWVLGRNQWNKHPYVHTIFFLKHVCLPVSNTQTICVQCRKTHTEIKQSHLGVESKQLFTNWCPLTLRGKEMLGKTHRFSSNVIQNHDLTVLRRAKLDNKAVMSRTCGSIV